MSRGSSQSWRGRAARPGPATQRGRAGGTSPASGTPATRAPPWSRPEALHSGTVGGTARGSQRGLAGGAALPGAWVGWGGVGCPRCHGDAAPPRGLGRELAAPSGCAPAPALTKPRGRGGGLVPHPGLSPHTARLAAGPPGRECLTLTGSYGWVGGVGSLPSGFRRGRTEGRQFRASRRSIGRRAAREEGAPSGPGKALEREARRRSLGRKELARRTQPRPTPIPAVRLPAPAFQAGERVRALSPAPGTGRGALRPAGQALRCL